MEEINQTAETRQSKKSKAWVWILVLIIIAAAGISVYYYYLHQTSKEDTNKNPSAQESNPNQTTTSSGKWKEGGVAIAGQFADADVVDLGNGKYRLYYSEEPEAAGFQGRIYSAISTDGVTWTKEDGVRKTWATFPDIIKLGENSWRMYFQNAGVVKSATSSDGLTWTDEAGTRIDKNETGFNLENVGAQSTAKLSDGTFVMVYRGTINTPYQASEPVPNKDTELYFWATSTDGLTFIKKGVAVDSRNNTLYGLADGADFVKWDSSTSSGQAELRIYFWSYTGIYHTVYNNGTFSAPVFDWTNNKNTMVKFAENPPSDPTLVKINNKWFMYYGQHTKGIYYAIFE